MMRRLLSVLFWSVIAAAFIGPGTVTAAASAGAGHRYALLWALVFSTVACLVLQEAAARLTVTSGRNLAEALRDRYPAGLRGTLVLLVVLGAIVVGCAAYEAGNILGGVAGATLALETDPRLLTLACAAVAASLLAAGNPAVVANLLGGLVAVMGGAFFVTAVGLSPDWGRVAAGAVTPALPTGGALLALALVGTTVVPYNLFLGSGLAEGRRLGEVRFGLTVAVVLGGLISMAVLVTGAALDGPFSFEALAGVLAARLGPWAAGLLALGLVAAGLSSAVTAPLAAAITARGLFDGRRPGAEWHARSWRYRAVWGGVLATGVAFGLSGVRPVPVILLAQALNGLLLPAVAAFLFVAVNDRRLVGEAGLNGPLSNGLTGVTVAVATLLGARGVLLAGAAAVGETVPPGALVAAAGGVALVVTTLLATAVARTRRTHAEPPS